jgi:hypothetical protein
MRGQHLIGPAHGLVVAAPEDDTEIGPHRHHMTFLPLR